MDKDLREELESAYAMITELHESGIMQDEVWQKCLVSLAYEYFVEEDNEGGVLLLNQCTPEYFRDIQPQQMREDSDYSIVAYFVAKYVVSKGLSEYKTTKEPEYVLTTTKIAKA